jgi:hypothetical protein
MILKIFEDIENNVCILCKSNLIPIFGNAITIEYKCKSFLCSCGAFFGEFLEDQFWIATDKYVLGNYGLNSQFQFKNDLFYLDKINSLDLSMISEKFHIDTNKDVISASYICDIENLELTDLTNEYLNNKIDIILTFR